MARGRLSGRDPDDARSAPSLAPRRARAAALLRAGRGGRDDHLPDGGARRLPPGHRRPARGRARGRRGLPALCLQDGDRLGQDDRHGDARRLEHPQQGRRARRRALLGCRARRLPERDDPRAARRARPEPRRGVDLPDARPRAAAPDAEPAPRAGARQELARVRAQGHERGLEGAAERRAGDRAGRRSRSARRRRRGGAAAT